MGVERSRPGTPHIKVQKAAATTIARGDIPVVWPKSRGSTTCPVIPSRMTKSSAVLTTMVQPGSTAAASASGNATAMKEPI